MLPLSRWGYMRHWANCWERDVSPLIQDYPCQESGWGDSFNYVTELTCSSEGSWGSR